MFTQLIGPTRPMMILAHLDPRQSFLIWKYLHELGYREIELTADDYLIVWAMNADPVFDAILVVHDLLRIPRPTGFSTIETMQAN